MPRITRAMLILIVCIAPTIAHMQCRKPLCQTRVAPCWRANINYNGRCLIPPNIRRCVDTKIFQAWFALSYEANLPADAAGSPDSARLYHLMPSLIALTTDLLKTPQFATVQRLKACRALEGFAREGAKLGCIGTAIEEDAPCASLPALFPALLP